MGVCLRNIVSALRYLAAAAGMLLIGTGVVQAGPAANSQQAGVNMRSVELNERGVVAVHSRDFALAERLFRQSLEADPYNLTAVFNLAGMFATNRKLDQAIQLLEEYTAKYPNDAGLWARLGDSYFGNKEVEKAQKGYEKALEVDPRHEGVAAKLSTVYALSNRLVEAERMLLRAVEETPQEPQLLANLASVQLSNGKIEESISTAKRALQVKASSEVYITLATAYELAGNNNGALIAFQRARDMGDNRPELQQKLTELKKTVKQN